MWENGNGEKNVSKTAIRVDEAMVKIRDSRRGLLRRLPIADQGREVQEEYTFARVASKNPPPVHNCELIPS